MIIAIGSDHRGFNLKESLKTWLHLQGYETIDLGTDSEESVDYSDFALDVGKTVADGKANLGILICGTGIGMSIAANKVKDIRAARVCTVRDAEMSKRHNNANLLCFGADTGIDVKLAQDMIFAWLKHDFEAGRHLRRVDKITSYENGY